MKSQLEPSDPRCEDLEEIIKASNRAFALTKQLLAFGRRQVVAPQVLDLNIVITDLGKMLSPASRRGCPTDDRFRAPIWVPLRPIRRNWSRSSSICFLNSRDAMPQGGRITISTANGRFDRSHERFYDEARRKATMSSSPSPIRGAAWTTRPRPIFSNRFLPPRIKIKAPALASLPSMASSSRTALRFLSRASWGREPPSQFISRAPREQLSHVEIPQEIKAHAGARNSLGGGR